jgi:hypothetical protein
MNSQSPHRKAGFGGQFTIRSLLILTTLVAAFFGGRASMGPVIEAERLRTKIAKQEAETHARRLDAIEQANTLQSRSIQRIMQARPTDQWRGIERAERQNMLEMQQRIDRAVNGPEL